MSDTDAGRGTGSDDFPVDGGLHHWRLGFRQFSFHHIPRVPQHLTPLRLGTTTAFVRGWWDDLMGRVQNPPQR